ncbi:class I SAM-dependent methyltransferase, partial [Streptomyces sp. TRM76130]|nr:class I SAM-dependent methyltransferase [Streptomyces sp. TRM76130]
GPPLPPAPPAEEIRRRRGHLHTRRTDRRAVSHHYDVGNDFYELVLGPSMVYSCAYWPAPESDGATLETAQRDKLELVCRKLD